MEVETGAAPFDIFHGTPAPQLLDGDGTPILGHSTSWRIVALEDDAPRDKRLSFLFALGILGGGEIGKAARELALTNIDVIRLDREKMEEVPIYTGDWSCEVPLPQNDTGWSQQTDAALELAEATV